MSGARGRFFRCQTIFGQFFTKDHVEVVACGYEGRPEKALRPRPSRKPVQVCPSCLAEVK